MRRTKIVCTIGPSSESEERIHELIRAGMDVARLNFSHGEHADHARAHQRIREAASDLNRPVATLMDLQGPKIRTGLLENGAPIELKDGASLIITTENIAGTAARISTTYAELPQDVKPGDTISMADGVLELKVEAVSAPEVRCRVIHGGSLGQHKGINLPGVAVSAPSVTEKDMEDLKFGLSLGVDYVALSFVRRPEDIRKVKRAIQEAGSRAQVVAKIERPEALECFEDILAETDVVMVARGDLGVEVPLDQVPQIQKDLIRKCNAYGTPVITATQMLESMMSNPRPTRAEANDVANAIYDGTDAVMLSGETAAGRFPIESVCTMARIAQAADEAIARMPAPHGDDHFDVHANAFSKAIGNAVYHTCEALRPRRIVCFTSSGYTAARIARYRPRAPISAFTLTEEAQRRCALYWGVDAVLCQEERTIDEMMATMDQMLLAHGLAQMGDTIIVAAGTPLAVAGRTNLMKLHVVGDT